MKTFVQFLAESYDYDEIIRTTLPKIDQRRGIADMIPLDTAATLLQSLFTKFKAAGANVKWNSQKLSNGKPSGFSVDGRKLIYIGDYDTDFRISGNGIERGPKYRGKAFIQF